MQDKEKLSNGEYYKKYEEWVENFTNTYANLSRYYAYTPQYGNTAIKDVNVHPLKPTKDQLQKMLLSPQDYEDEMGSFSEYLYGAVTQYDRVVNHLGNILSFDYILTPLSDIPDSDSEYKRYKYNEKKANTWLKRFQVKKQLGLVTMQIALKGGKYYYLRFSDDYIVLQEMPEQYCYITSRNEISYDYGLDMTFFQKYPSAISGYAPEFAEWYREFEYEVKYNKNKWIYKPMPMKKSVVFKLDEWSPMVRPNLSGTFKDALQIEDYKDLLRLKTELETWKVVFMEIPKDNDGIPTIDEKLAARFVTMVQKQLPEGVKASATPFEITPVNFDQSQNMNNISGEGEKLFWNGTGVANLFNSDNKGSALLKYSIMSDYHMMEPLYDQYEKFINYHLDMICKEYKFGIKFLRRSRYFQQEDTDKYFSEMQGGAPPELFMASRGFEPYEIEPFLKNSIRSNIRSYFIPTMSAHTQSTSDDKGGAPTKDVGQLSDSGDATRINSTNDIYK